MKKKILRTLLCGVTLFSMLWMQNTLTASAAAAMLGDADLNSSVDIDDAAMMLEVYACAAVNLPYELTDQQMNNADLDEDGMITISDATYALSYYAQTAAGLSPSWKKILPQAVDVSISLDGLNSPYATLIDAHTGEIIGARNSYDTVYPASMTKIMTAIVTIENFPDLNQYIEVPYAAVSTVWSLGGSTAGFSAGSCVPMIDMVYGMLLPSGCECCLTAAMVISGSESAFVNLMNQKAAELGMTGTHYANCTGLPDSNHYTTTADMAKLLRYALQNDTFRQVDTSSSYTASNGLYLSSTLFRPLINTYGSAAVTGGQIMGGKTGSTSSAGICLTSFAEIYGREYILCTAKAPYSGQHIQDARTVYNRLGNALS